MKTIELINGLDSDFSKEDLLMLLTKQINNFFVLDSSEYESLEKHHHSVLEKLKICIDGVKNKYFNKNGRAYFSPLHSGQYLIYLYIFSNHCYRNIKETTLSDKLYFLNKILNACDIYPAVELPKVFFLEHPVGTVLGRARYGENFFAMQGCTVGGNKNIYPYIGNNVKMYSNSKIIGGSTIGNNVQIGANTYIKDTAIPNDVTVFGQYPNLIIKNLR